MPDTKRMNLTETFSYRNGLIRIENINECPLRVRTQLLHVFLDECNLIVSEFSVSENNKILCEAIFRIGQIADIRDHAIAQKKNIDKLSNYITTCHWNEVYDFVEFYLQYFNNKKITKKVDDILRIEHTGYRAINNQIIPISNEMEINEISLALHNTPSHVCESIRNALEAYSSRTTPDYNSATSNIIIALEAMARTILKEEYDENANSLTQAMDKLARHELIPHDDLVNSIKKLYAYASDIGGVRHGKNYYANLASEDARFCIITCSAMINFLMVKYKYYQDKNKDNK